jgi:endonuclease/exonuclease/phosphatase (EEP) superfamily protein YafD
MGSRTHFTAGTGAALLLLLLAVVPVTATLLPLVREEDWWIRVFDFPRLQIMALSLGVLALALVWRRPGPMRWWVVAALSGCLAWQAAMIYPYTKLAAPQVLDAGPHADADGIAVLVANVLMHNRESERLLEIIRDADADVVLLLEPDAWWAGQVSSLEERYPHVVSKPLDTTYGMILYSRLELVEPRIQFLVRDDIPSIHTRVVMPSGVQVHLWCLHPEPPAPTAAEDTTERDVELLLVADEVKDLGQPAIVMGDLNDVAWSYTTTLFLKTSQLLDPRIGRGMFNTFDARNPLLRWPLDHVFFSDAFLLSDISRLQSFGSDHFPIYVRLVHDPESGKLQDGPEQPDRGDIEVTRDKREEEADQAN